MKPFVVVNPSAGTGRTRRAWPAIAGRLSEIYGPIEAGITGSRGHATQMVRQAVAAGARRIIAVGGDGTINEAVNGLCNGAEPPSQAVEFGAVVTGTGGDLRRSFALRRGAEGSLERLVEGKSRRIDLGRIRFKDRQGGDAVRWFVNVASFGLSAAVIEAASRARFSRLFGATTLYLVSSLSAMRRFDGRRVTLSLDDAGPIEMFVSMVAVANGRYFGGGMKVAPDANPCDGELDIVVLLQEPRVRPMEMRLVYAGAHLSHPAVRAMRGRRISAQCSDGRAVSIEADGEIVGLAPATFEIVPGALTLLW